MEELEKLVVLGEKIGLSGESLLKYIQEREEKEERRRQDEERKREEEYSREERKKKEDFEREERRAEREKQKLELELQIKIEENKKKNADKEIPRVSSKTPKLPTFVDTKDDLDAYLGRFERYAHAQKWCKEDWAVNLSALLTGRALETYYRLPEEEAGNYDVLKAALLKRYQLTEDGFRDKFFKSKAESGESASQYMARIENYLNRWIQLSDTEKTYVGLRDLFLREQFVNSCHRDLSVFLRERKLRKIEDVILAANNYQEAHGGHLCGRSTQPANVQQHHQRERSKVQTVEESTNSNDKRTCYHCQEKGHIAPRCPRKEESPVPRFYEARVCFICNRKGHIAKDCRSMNTKGPENTYIRKSAGLQIADDKEDHREGTACSIHSFERKVCACDGDSSEHAASFMELGDVDLGFRDNQVHLEDGHAHKVCHLVCKCPIPLCTCHKMPTTKGILNGFQASTMRDSGCSGIVVRAEYVHSKQYTGKNKLCLLIDGTARNVPTAMVNIDSPFFRGEAEAMVMPMPIYDLIIGNVPGAREPDNPDLTWNPAKQHEVGHAVVTRHQSQQKKAMKPLFVPKQSDIKSAKLKELVQEQESDATLDRVFDKAKNKDSPRVTKASMTWFETKRGVLYRMYKMINKPMDPVVKQLVVPKERRPLILKMAHEAVMSGHMGIQRTLDRIMSNFYWPGIHGDVVRYCRSCDICQRTTPKGRVQKMTLGQMPLVGTPFQRVAIDLVGPITPRSKEGNRYILTLVDYATRYPEAKALSSITTESVAEALMEIFSRIGFPTEMLSDLGTQFTSDVMREVSRLVSIKQLVTTPYHPICNGLVERLNGTLKTILKRLCAERPEDWDRYLPATLFAYREVPQESLGFSPFELIYGHSVRGPMDVLKTLWTKEVEDQSVETSYSYVTNLKERIEQTCKLAQEELAKSSLRYKKIYNRKARNRRLIPGQKALLLLPSDNNKLLMQWKGPFTVLERMNSYDYRIDINGKPRTFHINMLKAYAERDDDLKERAATVSLVETEDDSNIFEIVSMAVVEEKDCESGGEDLLEARYYQGNENYRDVKFSDDLTEDQLKQAKDLIFEFRDIFTDCPGNTDQAEHSIKLTTDEPIRQKPYPLPFTMREVVKKEVQMMLDLGVIEHTSSPYSSPIVIVRKKDDTNRFCIDFRRLNRVTVFDTEPMPTAEEIFAKLQDDKYFSKLDLAKGYWQIPVRTEDKEKTAFVTPDGSYQFKKMPFGLVNAGATFNRMMRKVMNGVEHADKFVDDLLGHTSTWDTHLITLREVFERLRDAKLTVRPSKCLIGFQSLEFVGHQIGQNAVQPNPNKVDEILHAERPKTKRQVRAFLGTVGYYREYIPNFAEIAIPLTDLTRKGTPNIIEWNDAHENAFKTLKKMITMDPILRIPDFTRCFILQSDASECGLGAALTQEVDGKKHPIAFASKKLLPRERRYSTIERECLALVWAIRKFLIYLYGREFIVETDHQPLAYINHAKFANNRIMRWAIFLQNFRFRIVAVKGKENLLADYLSRIHD